MYRCNDYYYLMHAEEIRYIYEMTRLFLNEKDRRLVIAAIAKAEGYGGISKVSKDTLYNLF